MTGSMAGSMAGITVNTSQTNLRESFNLGRHIHDYLVITRFRFQGYNETHKVITAFR